MMLTGIFVGVRNGIWRDNISLPHSSEPEIAQFERRSAEVSYCVLQSSYMQS
jgi:hypothetical protein